MGIRAFPKHMVRQPPQKVVNPENSDLVDPENYYVAQVNKKNFTKSFKI